MHSQSTIPTAILPIAELLDQFAELVNNEIDLVWRMDKPDAHLGLLEEAFEKILPAAIQLGEQADMQAPQDELAQWVVFDWLPEAKDFLILLRDVLFEEQKARLMVHEGRLDEAGFDQLRVASRSTLEEAADHLVNLRETEYAKRLVLVRKRKQWAVQRSPWPVYAEQFAALGEQTQLVCEQAVDLLLTADIYLRIKNLFTGAFSRYLAYLGKLNEGLRDSLAEVTEEQQNRNPSGLLKTVRNFVGQAPDPETAADFIELLEALTKGLPTKQGLVTGTQGGKMVRLDVNLQRNTTNWLESELMSELQDFFLRRGQIESRLQIALQTGENRIEFDQRQDLDIAGQEIGQTITQLSRNLERSEESIKKLEAEVIRHLEQELYASHAYEPGFLELSVQQTLSQYRRYQKTGLQQIRDWGKQKIRSLRDLSRESLREDQLGFSERVVRLVRARSVAPENVHYSSMFLTKGYTGESFRVGREAELSRVATIVDQWKLGYRGAVLITGQRMSGKTFFGELVAHRYFSNNFVTLTPGVRIEVGGRILEPTRDLKAAVDFVVRNSGHQQLMVWIDDLSNWRDEETPLSSDVLSLLDTIDYQATNLFFVVSVGSELHAQLRQFTDIDRHFQAIMNMPPMNLEDIRAAINIRHGATQLQLVDDEEQPLSRERIDQLIRSVYRASGGHIGNALQQWAYGAHLANEESVRFTEVSPFGYPQEMTEDAGLLLRTILVDRVTNEYQLRKQFGPIFRDVFQPLIQRMLNLGILLRKPTGALEINPSLVTDIEVLLEEKGFVTGYHLTDNYSL